MCLRESKMWNKLFKKEQKEKKVDVIADIEAVVEFLENINEDAQALIPELEKLAELEKERIVAKSGIIKVNIETQTKIMDGLLQKYQFLQDDADINGLRMKQIGNEILKLAQKEGLKDLVREKKKDIKWQFEW